MSPNRNGVGAMEAHRLSSFISTSSSLLRNSSKLIHGIGGAAAGDSVFGCDLAVVLFVVFELVVVVCVGGGAVEAKDMRLDSGMLVAWTTPTAFLVALVELTTLRLQSVL